MKKPTLLFVTIGLFFATSVSAGAKLEVMSFNYDAPGNDNTNENGEYIILKNVSGKKLKMRKWKITDNDKLLISRALFTLIKVIEDKNILAIFLQEYNHQCQHVV